ncbi:thiamine phosphate synthase [Desulfuromonas sp. TF]|uniref:thiamine phosphate synthase n=1 Tax=Desulfuromonas sp. TF TaxID=1232410 RepID=UPI00040B1C57|nr:thiamine phosphate synthase [Desulfuromonas sp. TF]
MPTVDFTLYLITDRRQVPPGRTLIDVVRAACEGGVRAVQLREKDLTADELFPLALELRALTRQYGARLLINDRIDLALAVEADGVHLGGHSLPTTAARSILGPERLIGVSAHSLEEIAEASRNGADFVTFGPVYSTPSKTAYGKPAGLDLLGAACGGSHLPVFALGGITPERVGGVVAAGAGGVALISAIVAEAEPSEAARTFISLLEKAGH